VALQALLQLAYGKKNAFKVNCVLLWQLQEVIVEE